MGSSQSVPWYNLPPRQFPAKRWLEQRYGFTLPALCFAQPLALAASDGTARRRFPAQVWLEGRLAGG